MFSEQFFRIIRQCIVYLFCRLEIVSHVTEESCQLFTDLYGKCAAVMMTEIGVFETVHLCHAVLGIPVSDDRAVVDLPQCLRQRIREYPSAFGFEEVNKRLVVRFGSNRQACQPCEGAEVIGA